MGLPVKVVQVPEGALLIGWHGSKIYGFRPSAPQYEGAYVVGNIYEPVAPPTPAPSS